MTKELKKEEKNTERAQSGFRSNHSTSTTLHDVQDYILKNNMNDGYVIQVFHFLILSKHFDTLNHDIPIKKLKHYGVDKINK